MDAFINILSIMNVVPMFHFMIIKAILPVILGLKENPRQIFSDGDK